MVTGGSAMHCCLMDRPTIIDVARLAGVSKKTVSRVINNSPLLSKEMREKVERIIAETGFVPNQTARALALKRNFLIALVYDNALASALVEVQAGMLSALKGSGFALCVQYLDCVPGGALRAFGDFLEFHRPSGILLMPPLSEQDQLAALAWESGCRCARLGANPKSDGPGWMSTPDRQASADAVSRLVLAGHRRIAFISGREDTRSARLRELGYLDSMAEHELDRGASLIAAGDDSFESGYSAAELLFEVSPRPSAIFAGNDEMAAGAIHAAHAKGIAIPDELSVIGFDDTPIASRIWPPLTTIRVPLAEMAHAAAAQLIAPEGNEPTALTFAAELIERGTHAPLHAPLQPSAGASGAFAFHSG